MGWGRRETTSTEVFFRLPYNHIQYNLNPVFTRYITFQNYILWEQKNVFNDVVVAAAPGLLRL